MNIHSVFLTYNKIDFLYFTDMAENTDKINWNSFFK